MTDYIVRETEYPLATGQEVMGELIRCHECKHWEYDAVFPDGWCRRRHQGNPDWFCGDAEMNNQ